MLDRYFFDTNVFLYSILEAKNDADLEKKEISLNLISVGNQQESYGVEVYDEKGILGFSCEYKLTEYFMKNLDKHRFFIEMMCSFYQGKKINFPVDLGEFEI
ncbi:MAG: hypothetical protein SAL07_17390 [Oscillatoria sp. PMC 1051.18]|nr:hypothetical protein [Oscillatoria sp. PMC 1050.18]MEC5031677.1 hypothetical protein [Oscillatoria sp. PMC 1051.18]